MKRVTITRGRLTGQEACTKGFQTLGNENLGKREENEELRGKGRDQIPR